MTRPTATFVKKMTGFRGDAALYRLDPPFTGPACYSTHDDVADVDYVIVSAVSWDDLDEPAQQFAAELAEIEVVMYPKNLDSIAMRKPGDVECKVFISDAQGSVNRANMTEYAATETLSHDVTLAQLGQFGYDIVLPEPKLKVRGE